MHAEMTAPMRTTRTPHPRALRAYGAVIALGFFGVMLASPKKIAGIPLQSLIKGDLGLSPEAMEAFFLIAGLPWYLKPFAGVLSDRVPLFGTRRRHYLLASALAGACLWALTIVVPHRYLPLMAISMALNTMFVLATTALGGLLVDGGHAEKAAGRLSAIRTTAMNAASLTGSLAGGLLATWSLAVTCGVSAAILLTVALAVALFLQEPHASKPAERALGGQIRSIAAKLRSRALLGAIALTFLYYAMPSPDGMLFFYRTDALHLSTPAIGVLDTLQCAGGLLGALAYTFLCRPFNFRTLLFAGIGLKAACALLYVAYDSPTAALLLEGLIGFIDILSVMPIQELAVRAAPPSDGALCLSIILSAGNFAIGISKILGASLYQRAHLSLTQIGVVQAVTTALLILFIPLLPRALLAVHEGRGEGAS